MSAHVLMLSSSRAGDDDYLAHAKSFILAHLKDIGDILFVPYAGVTVGWDDYTAKVQQALPEIKVTGLHTFSDPASAIMQAKENNQAVLVGGGNTFSLLSTLYKEKLTDALKAAIDNGVPYIGWSAGSNICGASIFTTNDMPIVEPPTFVSLGILPCQINPHYSDYHPPGFNGETRDQRLTEFTTLHPDMPVLAIREGTALVLSKQRLVFSGSQGGFIFLGSEKKAIHDGDDLTEFSHQ